MKLTISCPHCEHDIVLNIENDEVVSVSFSDTEIASQKEISETLSSHNIEFG